MNHEDMILAKLLLLRFVVPYQVDKEKNTIEVSEAAMVSGWIGFGDLRDLVVYLGRRIG